MDLLTENRPETCAALGLKCGACVRLAAASVAGICQDLDATGIQNTFFQLYPSAGCRPMAKTFAFAYLECTATSEPVLTFATAAA